MIQKLHHAAYRCRDSEETRQFYEDFLGLPLTHAFEITTTATGNQAEVLHTFYALDDGSSLAFFEAPRQPFDFKIQHQGMCCSKDLKWAAEWALKPEVLPITGSSSQSISETRTVMLLS